MTAPHITDVVVVVDGLTGVSGFIEAGIPILGVRLVDAGVTAGAGRCSFGAWPETTTSINLAETPCGSPF